MVKARVFVEGDDDRKFIVTFLNHLKKEGEITVDGKFETYIENMGGKSKLLDSENNKYQKTSTQIEINKIEKVLFVFDCDFKKDDEVCGGMESSEKCFKALIDNLKWKIEIDRYIFDKNLDYFLLETIKNKECYEHFDELVECLDIENTRSNKKPIANLYRDLYPYPRFDFKDDAFNPLKEKLKKLFQAE